MSEALEDYLGNEQFKRDYYAEGGHWQGLANCRDIDPEIMQPDPGPDLKVLSRGELAAKKICEGCIVVQECLDTALRNDEPVGVWGGQTEKQRGKFRTQSTGR